MYNYLSIVGLLCHTMHMRNDDNHCLLVRTDLTLTMERLMELFQLVHMEGSGSDIFELESYEKHEIGDYLGLPESVLEITRSYWSATKRKEVYLDTYTHHHPCPSWKKISEVLRRCELNQQAREVENTYVQGIHACIKGIIG